MTHRLVALLAALSAATLVLAGCGPPPPVPTATRSPSAPTVAVEPTTAPLPGIEMFVESLRTDEANAQFVVMLKGKEDERFLPIWIGPLEAQAIALPLQGVKLRRPMTHDLLQSVIATLGADVVAVTVTAFDGGTYYARLSLDRSGRSLEIDSRPSDAIALAVRTGAPIYVTAPVLDAQGVRLDQEEELFQEKKIGVPR